MWSEIYSNAPFKVYVFPVPDYSNNNKIITNYNEKYLKINNIIKQDIIIAK